MNTLKLNIIVFLLSVDIFRVNCSTRLDVKTLKNQLLQDYDKDIGPNFNQSEPVTLTVSFNLFYLQEFDDKGGKLVFVGVFNFYWNDDRIVWDPLQHGNTTTLRIPQSKIWTPLLLFAKPYDDLTKIGQEYLNVQYYPDGTASWQVADIFETSCTADVAYFPFDRQRCEMYLFPWGSLEDEFEFDLPFDYMTEDEFIENGSWEVISTHLSTEYRLQGNILIMVIKFQRRPLFDIINLFLPIGIICILNIFIFLLPPEPGERSAFGVTVLLALAVFLSIISDKLPSSSQPHIPRVSVYLLGQLALSAVTMVFAMFGQKLYNKGKEEPIPNWLPRFVARFVKRKKHDRTEGNSQNIRKKSHNNKNEVNIRQEEEDRVFTRVYKYNGDHGYYGSMPIPHNNTEDYIRPESAYYPSNKRTSSASSSNMNREETDINDAVQLSWPKVAKCFDIFCIVLFSFLNLFIFVFEIVDVVVYQNSEF